MATKPLTKKRAKKARVRRTRKKSSPKKKRPFDPKTFAISALRRASYRLGARYEALNKAKISYGVYACAACKKAFARKNVQVDHITPIVPLSGWDNFDGYIARLFCHSDGLQILCIGCHKSKTKEENAARKALAKKEKA